MFCVKCGSQNPDEASFCWNCGSPIQKGQPTPHTAGPTVEQPAVNSATPPPVTTSYSVKREEVEYAGFWRRLGAIIIDWLILAIPNKLIGLSMGLSVMPFFLGGNHLNHIDFSDIMGLSLMAVQASILQAVIAWLYFSFFESSKFQATPGKMALGLVVTDLEGKPINFFKATARHLAKIVSSVILGIGWLMAGWTQKKQALHDIIADTLVVKKEREY